MNTKSVISLCSVLSFTLVASVWAETPEAVANKVEPVVLVKSVDIHAAFAMAKKAFLAKDMNASSAAISEAATMVSNQASAADIAYATPLVEAAGNLNELAKSVGVGDMNDVKELDSAFATTHQTLAEFYQAKAQRAYDAGDKTVAAKAMGAAANHVENGATWAGKQLSDTAKGTVGLLRKVSGGILSGAGTGVEKVGDVLGKGTGTIANVGKMVRAQETIPDANVAERAVKGAQGVASGAVEGAGKVAEKGTDAVKSTGKGLKKLGEAVKGEEQPEGKDQ